MATTTAPAPEKKAPVSDRVQAENKLGWKLAGPAVALMLLVTAWPMLRALYLGFFNYRLTDPDAREFVWFGNYATILTDPLWWKAVGVAVFIMVVTVSVELVIGFGFAMVMHRIIFARGVVRTSILVPYGIITVVAAFAWQFAFSPGTGFIADWIGAGDTYDPFGGFWSSMLVICLAEIWKTTPFISLLLLAGLAQVSDDMQEAAKVDGATWTQILVKVILPSMRAAIMVAVLFRALDAFRVFDSIFIMTAGANGTGAPSQLVFSAINQQLELGLGSAMSVLLFLSVLIVAYVLMKVFKVDLSQARGD